MLEKGGGGYNFKSTSKQDCLKLGTDCIDATKKVNQQLLADPKEHNPLIQIQNKVNFMGKK